MNNRVKLVTSQNGKHKKVKLTCETDSKWMWFFNHGFVPLSVKLRGNTLKIKKIRPSNSGKYECIGTVYYHPHYSYFSSSVSISYSGKL